jgi:hypothetical protein
MSTGKQKPNQSERPLSGETARDDRAGGTRTAYDEIIGRLKVAKKAFLVRPDPCCEIGRIHHAASPCVWNWVKFDIGSSRGAASATIEKRRHVPEIIDRTRHSLDPKPSLPQHGSRGPFTP